MKLMTNASKANRPDRIVLVLASQVKPAIFIKLFQFFSLPYRH